VPDECEPDCNENGLADSCDIALGTSDDLDGDSIPDECAGFSLTPVVASGQHFISGNKLTLVRGAQRIVADFRMSGWDPDQDGFPRLRLYQAGLEIPGLDLGSDGPFEFAVLNCTNNDDCLGDSLCVDGVCDIYGSLNIDTLRPDFVFYGLDAIATSAVFNQYPDVFAILIDYVEAVIDDGETRYAGTLVLDTNENAEGEFTIGFHEKSCVMEHTSEKIAKYDIPIPGFHPMIVVIQDGYDLLDASLLQNCASIDGETVDCAALDADGDGMVNTQDLRAFTALMAGPVP
jgi:hypothetical protein